MHSVDIQVFHWINHWPDSQAPLWVFMSEAMQRSGVKVALGILILTMLIRNANTRKTILLALVSVFLANEFTDVLKFFLATPRPYQSPAVVDAIIRCGLSDNPGTASAHSANMAAIATIFCLNLRYWGIPWIAVALLTGISRSYVAAHYPSQVLLGWFCGVLMAFLVHLAWQRIVLARSTVKEANGIESA